ncbi:MAG: hypothetical protein WBA61_14045 [Aequorivita sp.]
MKFFLKCNEATHVCDKAQYKEAGWFERIFLKLHLVLCKCCRGYSSNNDKLSKALKSSKLQTLPPEEKRRMKSLIEQNNSSS